MDRERRDIERNPNFTKDMPAYWVHRLRAGDIQLRYEHNGCYTVIKGRTLVRELLTQVSDYNDEDLYYRGTGENRESFSSLYGDCLQLYQGLPPMLGAIFGKYNT